MSAQVSSFLGDGWNAAVTSSEGSIEVRVLLVGVAVSGMAVLTLPLRSRAGSLKALANTVFADEVLLAAAIEVHIGNHPLIGDGAPRSVLAPLQFTTSASVQAMRAKKSARAKRSKQASCARQRR